MEWMQNTKWQWQVMLPAFGAFAALATAYASQWFFGLHPCEMCQWQRIPYGLMLVVFVAACAVRGRALRGFSLLMVLLLVVEMVLAVYHAGVEWRWWQGITACSMGLGEGLSTEEMLQRILNAAIVSCAEPPFRFLGLSMAGWNAVYAFCLLLVVVLSCKRGRCVARCKADEAGFSLVELSVVLVVLGLLAGAVVGGRHLIRAAELRAIPTEYEDLLTAVRTFEERYDGLPGDLPNAESLWGTASSCPPAAGSVVASGTCNGNGNGRIGDHNAAAEIYEQFTAWQQLAYAGLIPGHYTGAVGTASSYHALIGQNVPASRMPAAGWTMRFRDHFPVGEAAWFVMDYGNAFVFGKETTTITVGGGAYTGGGLYHRPEV